MPNIKSQMKRVKTNEKSRQRNKAVKSALRTYVRNFRRAAEAGDVEVGHLQEAQLSGCLSLPLPFRGCTERLDPLGGRGA